MDVVELHWKTIKKIQIPERYSGKVLFGWSKVRSGNPCLLKPSQVPVMSRPLGEADPESALIGKGIGSLSVACSSF